MDSKDYREIGIGLFISIGLLFFIGLIIFGIFKYNNIIFFFGLIGSIIFALFFYFPIKEHFDEQQRDFNEQKRIKMRELGVPENAIHDVCSIGDFFVQTPSSPLNYNKRMCIHKMICKNCGNDLMKQLSNDGSFFRPSLLRALEHLSGVGKERCEKCGGKYIDIYWTNSKEDF